MTTAGLNMAQADSPADTVGALVSWAAAQYGGRAAYIDAGRTYTYADMERAADALACGLHELGLRRGDRIGLIGLNQIEWLRVFFAAARIGVVVVAMTVRYRDNELQYMANDSGVKAIFTVAEHEGFDFLTLFRRLSPGTPSIRHLVCIDRPPTLVGGVPTMLTLLLMNARSERVDLGRVRLVTIGGSNVESALMEQVQQRMPGATIMNLYGLSEASGALVMSPWDATGQELLETIGKPLPGVEVQVRSLDGGIADTGEVGRYYIVPRPDSQLTEDEVRQYCREHIADYKVPRQIVLRDALPLTPAGKIHKAALREEAGRA
jgi:acyl-CoA synthetase (AMP-forming)/AMP-acid ligase II